MIRMDLHLHSNFSDGKNSPEEMVVAAISKGLDAVAITDHVRRSTDWLDEYVEDINVLREKYRNKIKVLSGIEAKILDLVGNVDAEVEFFHKVDIVLAAFHGIPTNRGFLDEGEILENKNEALMKWNEALMAVLSHPYVTIIAHPTKILRDFGIELPKEMKVAIAGKAKEYGKIFEINIRYSVPDEEFLAILADNGVRMVIGSDSHSVEELQETNVRDNYDACLSNCSPCG